LRLAIVLPFLAQGDVTVTHGTFDRKAQTEGRGHWGLAVDLPAYGNQFGSRINHSFDKGNCQLLQASSRSMVRGDEPFYVFNA
jgi:hypothetical protein